MRPWFLLCVTLTVVAAAASLYVFFFERPYLPEKVAVHWGLEGQPDHFVARDEMLPYLLLPPGVMAALLVLWRLLPWLSPKHFEVDSFRGTYDQVFGIVVLLMGYLDAAITWSYFQPGFEPVRLVVAGIFLFLALIGNVLGKVKRNFWMGVRTPWTLASEAVWERTHRLAAWLFVGAGLLGCAGAVLGAPLLACFVLVLAAALIPVIYSLVIYKRLEKQGRL